MENQNETNKLHRNNSAKKNNKTTHSRKKNSKTRRCARNKQINKAIQRTAKQNTK